MLRYFWKRENIRKKLCWNRRLRLLFTLWIRVSRKFYLQLFFKLRYYIQHAAKILQKLTPGFKNHMRNLDSFTQVVESPDLKFDGLLLSKKYILQLEHYKPKIYLTLPSTTCVKIHQITYVIFEAIYKPFFTTRLHCIFFTQTLHTFYKLPIKVQIFRFSTAWVNVHQFSHVIFQTKNQFFFKVWIFFQCHER